MKNDLVDKWRKLIVETETKLKEFEDRPDDPTYEEKCVYEVWEHFLWNQKSSLENYINFLNNNHKIKEDK